MNAGKIIAGIVVAIAATVFFSIFIVKEVNQAIVLQFGDPKRIILKPGLNFKIPFIQNVVYLDKRILNLDTPPEEVIASDQKRLIVDAFARFQIVDPLKFSFTVNPSESNDAIKSPLVPSSADVKLENNVLPAPLVVSCSMCEFVSFLFFIHTQSG